MEYGVVSRSEPGFGDKSGVVALADLVRALRHAQIELGEEVVVLGSGLEADVVAELARRAGALAVRVLAPGDYKAAPERSADAVILMADIESLKDGLALVRNQGRALVLASAGRGRIDFDLYPDLHKRSIRLIWPDLASPLSPHELAFAQHISSAWGLPRGGDVHELHSCR
jgi:hypothetical protein